jgi:hypothetical protein
MVTLGYYINRHYKSQEKSSSVRGYKMSLPESKRRAAEPQPNRGTAILAVSVTGGRTCEKIEFGTVINSVTY